MSSPGFPPCPPIIHSQGRNEYNPVSVHEGTRKINDDNIERKQAKEKRRSNKNQTNEKLAYTCLSKITEAYLIRITREIIA
jgi:hypothetical protein